jgi:hypothetical protein
MLKDVEKFQRKYSLKDNEGKIINKQLKYANNTTISSFKSNKDY